jgi:very-short-patch-repair endonuclease
MTSLPPRGKWPEGPMGVYGAGRLAMAANARRETIANARAMRKTLTPPEARLWMALRGRGLGGLKFRRQHPIGAYVRDFYCPALRLAVEVDGMWHSTDEQVVRDHVRDSWLRQAGVRCCGFLRDELDRVLDAIERAVEKLGRATHSAPPKGERSRSD